MATTCALFRICRHVRSTMSPLKSRLHLHSVRRASQLGHCAVIGGNGFVGMHLVRQLVGNGHRVRVLDIGEAINPLLRDKSAVPNDGTLEYVHCDIGNADHVDSALQDIHTVFHCAAMIDIVRFCPSPKMHRVNVDGTENIMAFCNDRARSGNVSRNMIYTSSIEVYTVSGRKGDALRNMSEDLKVYGLPYPQKYGETKSIAEQIVLDNSVWFKIEAF